MFLAFLGDGDWSAASVYDFFDAHASTVFVAATKCNPVAVNPQPIIFYEKVLDGDSALVVNTTTADGLAKPPRNKFRHPLPSGSCPRLPFEFWRVVYAGVCQRQTSRPGAEMRGSPAGATKRKLNDDKQS